MCPDREPVPESFTVEIYWQEKQPLSLKQYKVYELNRVFVDRFISTNIDNANALIEDIIQRKRHECPAGYEPTVFSYPNY